MPRILRTYQQNLVGLTASDIWTFRFADIPRKAKPSNRFKLSVSSLSMYSTQTTGANTLYPHLIWMTQLPGLTSSTADGSTTNAVSQVTNATLLGVLGQHVDVNGSVALTTKSSNTTMGTPFYWYMSEMPTTDFNVFYTHIHTVTYSSGVNDINLVISFLIEEEEA